MSNIYKLEGKARGGARPGAGRKPNPSQRMRVPEEFVPTVTSLLDRLKLEELVYVEELGIPAFESSITLPLYTTVPCGFASPAEDYLTGEIDLNEVVMDTNHRAATFLVRARGHSMMGAGIYDGNILVVDRALTAKNGSIVIAIVRQEATCKRLLIAPDGTPILRAENPHYADRNFAEGESEVEIWGVVRYCLNSLL